MRVATLALTEEQLIRTCGRVTLAAVVVGVANLEALEVIEMAQDVTAYGAARAEDDRGVGSAGRAPG